jgi:hypothetical protein
VNEYDTEFSSRKRDRDDGDWRRKDTDRSQRDYSGQGYGVYKSSRDTGGYTSSAGGKKESRRHDRDREAQDRDSSQYSESPSGDEGVEVIKDTRQQSRKDKEYPRSQDQRKKRDPRRESWRTRSESEDGRPQWAGEGEFDRGEEIPRWDEEDEVDYYPQIQIVKNQQGRGGMMVQMELETYKRMRDFVMLADKYVMKDFNRRLNKSMGQTLSRKQINRAPESMERRPKQGGQSKSRKGGRV